MGKVEEIEKAVAELTPADLAKFRRWFEKFESDLFDAKIQRDATEGRLDKLAEQALADLRTGRTREL